MTIYNSGYCASCQYWDGPRKVSVFKDKADVKSSDDKGVCTNKKAANFRGKTKKAREGFGCNYFEKWDQLK